MVKSWPDKVMADLIGCWQYSWSEGGLDRRPPGSTPGTPRSLPLALLVDMGHVFQDTGTEPTGDVQQRGSRLKSTRGSGDESCVFLQEKE